MENTVFLDSIEKTYRVGLMFSLFEGLKQGQKIRFITSIDPNEIKDEFLTANAGTCLWASDHLEPGSWEIIIGKKMESGGGCCGACGG